MEIGAAWWLVMANHPTDFETTRIVFFDLREASGLQQRLLGVGQDVSVISHSRKRTGKDL